MELVSIIIPVFNRENLIKITIETIKKQTYKDFECLLIDDASTDDSLSVMNEISKSDKRFKVFLRESKYPKGPAGCRNMGLDIANGKYIQFFDSDDLMHPDHIKLKIESYNNGSDLVVCQLGEFKDDNPNEIFSISKINDCNDIIKHISGEINYYLPGPMWKKEIIESTRFYTNVKIYEDLIFNIINRKKCTKVCLIQKPLIYYRRHKNSTTGTMTQDIQILEQKRLAWEYIYNIVKIKNNTIFNNKIKSILFYKSCLNFYYLLCQKSLKFSFKQFKDIFKYISSLKELFIALYLSILAIIPFLFKKGYKIYHIKNNKGNN